MNIGKYVQLYSDDLRLKNYSEATIKNYCSQVALFLSEYEKVASKPSEINEKMIKDWLMKAVAINSRKHRLSAVKLFYQLTGKQPLKFKYIEYPRSDKKLPVVLSVQEVQRMFDACDNLKHKVILALLYSCGLRVGELINLRWADIDRSRMVINVVRAKGNKDRQVMLNDKLIPLLTTYCREYHLEKSEFVLTGQLSSKYSAKSVGEVVKQLATKAGINKRVYSHLMRHNCFTHLVESGCDVNIVQRLAGHSNVKTTMMYCHISHNLISNINSPLNAIYL